MKKAAMLEELVRHAAPARIEEDEFTVYEYRGCYKTLGLPVPPRRTANDWLQALVEEGVLTCRLVLLNSKWTRAYRKVGGEEDAKT